MLVWLALLLLFCPRGAQDEDARLVLNGRIVDAATGEGIAGAEVRFAPCMDFVPPWRDASDPLAVAASDGSFAMSARTGTELGLWVDAPGFGPLAESIHVDEWGAERVFRLPRAGTFVSRLAEDQPAPEAFHVRVSWREQGWPLDARWGASLHDGSCRVESLPANMPLSVELMRGQEVWRRLSPPLLLEPGQTVEHCWEREPSTNLRGRLVDGTGNPRPGAKLWLLRSPLEDPVETRLFLFADLDERLHAEAVTDDDGAFEFTELPADTWFVGPAPGGPLCPLAERVRTEAGRKAEVRLDGGLGHTIEGRVLDPRGEPTEAWVQATCRDPGALVTERAGPDGRFTLGPLPAGAFELEARESPHAPSVPREAAAGESGVELHLRTGASIEVRGDGPARPSGRGGWFWLSQAGTFVTGRNWSGDDGRFTLDGLAPGTYDLAAVGDGWTGVFRGIRAGPGAKLGVAVRLQPAGRLRVRYAGSWPQAGLTVFTDETVVVPTISLQPAGSTLAVVPAGPLRIELRFREERVERRVEVTAGETLEVLFE